MHWFYTRIKVYYISKGQLIKEVNTVGKYQLDKKGKEAVSKYHEKQTPNKIDKKAHLAKLRESYMKKKK